MLNGLTEVGHAPIHTTSSNERKAWVSLKRVENYILSDDLALKRHMNSESDNLTLSSASFSWDQDCDALLTDVSLDIKPGEFICIVGLVGSGKSSLLNAILGEMVHLSGTVCLPGSAQSSGIGLAAQEPWIQVATAEDFRLTLVTEYVHP